MTDRHGPDSSHTVIDPPSVGGALPGEIPEDPRIVELVQEYLAQLERGETPDRAAYVQRYPEISGAVAECLEGLDLVRAETRRAPSSRSPDGAGGAPAEATDRLPDPLGDFRIVRELARGGMGIVYEAEQLSLGRRVALKVLPFAATLDARHLQRFKSEAQAAALLHHTNIVPVFAVGCERGVHFYAMQLIEGQSLAALIAQLRRQAGMATPDDAASRGSVGSSYVLGADLPPHSSAASRGGRPPTPAPASRETSARYHAELSTQHAGRDSRFFNTAARLMLQAAQALEHAHEFGIVHRDIKPANLLLDVHGTLWVTYFGLAQFHAEAGLTRTGDIPGTLRYMSPEQASGRRALLDRRTDVYSLGATFYELLTLEPIFKGRDLQYLLHQVLHAEPRPLRQIDKTIPAELETIILKCVSKGPEERYGSAGELALDLDRFLTHQPILARRPSIIDRARKWARRNPGYLVAGAIIFFLVSVVLFISNQREKDRADAAKLRANQAEERFQQAKRAVDVLIEVSEMELADLPWQAPRRRLLRIALDYYQDFIEERRGDTAAQGELAVVQERVKRILDELTLLQRDVHTGYLENAAVQEALALTSDQKEKLAMLLKEWSIEREYAERTMQGRDADARRRQAVKLAQTHDDLLAKVLSSTQRARLSEIAIQAQGVFAFNEPEIVDELQLTKDQRSAIRKIIQDLFAKATRPPEREGDRARGREGSRERARTEALDQVLAQAVEVLTPQQARRWHELTGPTFADAPALRWGRRGDRPMGPPRQPN